MNTTNIDEYNLTMLQMLQALARSQCAIASIMEQAALVATEFQLPVSLIQDQLRTLANYQSAMITQLSGIRVMRVKCGEPANEPWLNNKLMLRKL